MSHLHETPRHVVKHRGGGFLVCLPSGDPIWWTKEKEVANVLASAPDLLSSLKELAEEVDFEIEQRMEGGNDEDWLDLKAKSDRAHAAIAKAEGRS